MKNISLNAKNCSIHKSFNPPFSSFFGNDCQEQRLLTDAADLIISFRAVKVINKFLFSEIGQIYNIL